MQAGKEVHRGGRRLKTVLCAAVFGIVLNGSASGSADAGRRLAWALDEPASDAGYACFEDLAAGERLAAFHACASNPYMLEGLVASRIRGGLEAPGCSVWLDWGHRGHELYREDRLDAAICFGLPFGGCRFAVVPGFERRGVRGFRADRALSCRLAASYAYRERSFIGFSHSLCESAPEWTRASAIHLLYRASRMTVALDRPLSAPHAGDARLSVAVRLDASCSIRLGYRWCTEELSTGLAVAVAPTVVDFSWSRHPALGSTLSIGIGRFWEW